MQKAGTQIIQSLQSLAEEDGMCLLPIAERDRLIGLATSVDKRDEQYRKGKKPKRVVARAKKVARKKTARSRR